MIVRPAVRDVVRQALRRPFDERRGGGSVAPSTLGFTDAQSFTGWTMQTTTTKVAGRRYAMAGNTVWAGYITGTDASIDQRSEAGPGQGLISVSVDGGAFSDPIPVGTVYPLFAGLAHGRHLVVIRPGGAYGDYDYVLNTGTVFSVTGQPPSIQPFGNWRQPGDLTTDSRSPNLLIPTNVAFSNTFLPGKVGDDSSQSVRQNVPSIVLRGDFTELAVAANNSRYFGYSVDGAAPVYVDRGSQQTTATRVTGLSGVHTYHVFGSTAGGFAVGGLATTLTTPPSKKVMDHYGHSIVEGTSATSPIHTDLFRWAPGLGYIPSNFGLAGDTIANLKLRVAVILAGKTVVSGDVALLDIGRNDGFTTWTAQQISDYQNIVNQLLTAGYSRIICSGILPEGGTPNTAPNSSMQSIVTGFANAKVVYCNTDSWNGIATSDGTHPTDAGYVTLAAYRGPAIAALV